MMQASWKGQVLARSNATKVVEGNHYFPRESVDTRFLVDSNHSTHCGWKGDASYYDVVVADEVNKDAAWYYADPYTRAEHIKGYVAFWKGVAINEL